MGLTSKGVVALKPENVILPQRTRVTIQDVISRPQLNGRAGSIRDVEGDRYVVDLPGRGATQGPVPRGSGLLTASRIFSSYLAHREPHLQRHAYNHVRYSVGSRSRDCDHGRLMSYVRSENWPLRVIFCV